ncbi:MAG TPA: hypothetical protein VEZ90_09100 [Blastocatellia bacterium]|nr:hypothetical protein [Blastocatellia bacterium]
MKAKEVPHQVTGSYGPESVLSEPVAPEPVAEDTLTEKIFDAIGLAAADDSAYDRLIERADACGESSLVFRDNITVYGKCWHLGGGLEVWTVLYDGPSERYYADCRPAFRSRYVHILSPWELIEYCEDGEAIVRGRVKGGAEVVLELQNFTELSSRVLREPALRLGIAGLAWNVRVESGQYPLASPSSFVPASRGSDQAGENEYLVRGRVLASREIINPVNNNRVNWIFVDCGSLRIELVASSGSIGAGLKVGALISADVWLQGHVLAEHEIAARYEGVDGDYHKGDFRGLLRRAN